jgi:hypothetical protein
MRSCVLGGEFLPFEVNRGLILRGKNATCIKSLAAQNLLTWQRLVSTSSVLIVGQFGNGRPGKTSLFGSRRVALDL